MGAINKQHASEREERIFGLLSRVYVQEADERQKRMGLTYTTAETHELARTIAGWIDRGLI